jgi:hypothetical protein
MTVAEDIPPTGVRSGPWGSPDHLALITANILCAAGVLVCWIGSGEQVGWHPQLPWLEGAITAALTAAIADCVWLLGALQQTRSLRRDVVLRASVLSVPAARETIGSNFVIGPRMTAFHRPSCLLVLGKPVAPLSQDQIRRADPRPCPMCLENLS